MAKRRFTVEEALALLAGPEGKRSALVFEHGTLQAKIYSPRGLDTQTPHTRDEVYIVISGSGFYVIDDARERFSPGDFLFAPAGIPHRFEEFTDDFAVWVLFYGPEGGEAKR